MRPLISIKHLHITMLPRSDIEAVPGSLDTGQAVIGMPEIGEHWPEQGGVLAGVMPAQEGHPSYALILATADEAKAEKLAWGGYQKNEDGATSSWDGLANTNALAASSISHPAAEFCHNLSIGQHRDFYLPSRREASLMAATVPHLFQEGWHWTSTQCSAYSAFIQFFDDGDQDDTRKDDTYRVRAVRRFIIN